MNGFSAADMSTAAANGHAEGYQAGCADAVKAVEAGGSPEADARTQIRNAFFKGVARTCDEVAPGIILSVAAQEAVAWQRRYARPAPDGSRYEWHEISREQYLEATKGKWASAYELRELFDRPAPVAAAPVDAVRERDLLAEAIGNAAVKSGIYRADMQGMTGPQLMMACDDMAQCIVDSTPVAPGIDLEQFRALAEACEDMRAASEECDIGEGLAHAVPFHLWNEFLSKLDAAQQAIDASPKGGEHFQDRLAEIEGRPRPEPEVDEVEEVAACLGDDAAAMLDENPEDERALNMQRAAELLTAMQATSAEVGS